MTYNKQKHEALIKLIEAEMSGAKEQTEKAKEKYRSISSNPSP